MTLNSKVLSLVLLSGLTMGGAFAGKKSKSFNPERDSHTILWSEEKCDSNSKCPVECVKKVEEIKCTCACKAEPTCNLDICKNLCNDDCSVLDQQCCKQVLCFQAALSHRFTITAAGAPASEDPDADKICGLFELCFNSTGRSLEWRVTICGAKACNVVPANGAVVLAKASDPIDGTALFATTPSKDLIFKFDLAGGSFDATTGSYCKTGTWTQAQAFKLATDAGNITPASAQSLQPLALQAALDNNLTAIIYTLDKSATCTVGSSYDHATPGLLRGTLLECCCN